MDQVEFKKAQIHLDNPPEETLTEVKGPIPGNGFELI